MKALTPSARMSNWTITPAEADTYRLEDPCARRAQAQHALSRLRSELQATVESASASGTDARELLARPSFRQALSAGLTALREVRVADALLAL
jgi:hypothetical protein